MRQPDEDLATRAEHAWARIVAWLSRVAPEVGSALPAGADNDVIDAAEAALGVRLPGDLRRWLARANGSGRALVVQPTWSPAGYSPWRLYAATEIVCHTTRDDIDIDNDFRSSWVAIGDPDFSRHLMCVDVEEGANFGRVAFVRIGEGPGAAHLANSLAEFFERCADAMDAGDVVAVFDEEDEQGGLMRRTDADDDRRRIRG